MSNGKTINEENYTLYVFFLVRSLKIVLISSDCKLSFRLNVISSTTAIDQMNKVLIIIITIIRIIL